MMTERLQQAIQLIKAGEHHPARDLLLEEVKDNPRNLAAWVWALEVAANEKEQRLILHKILSIDPTHQAAQAFLRKLDQQGKRPAEKISSPADPDPSGSGPSPTNKQNWLSGLLRLAFDWVTSLPSGCFFIALFFSIVVGALIYTRVNTSLFGLAGADFDSLVVSNSYQQIASDDYTWDVDFESLGTSQYQGIVRHVAPIRIEEFAILTHDILVTTGDFADPDVVTTTVVDHKFFWRSSNTNSPAGRINLIHALPANKEIYQELLEIQKWDTVKITGREILTVKTYHSDSTFLGTWQDAGCNTLLIESVSIMEGTGQE